MFENRLKARRCDDAGREAWILLKAYSHVQKDSTSTEGNA